MSKKDSRVAPSMTALNAIFCALGVFGAAVTWGRVFADGSMALLLEALDGQPTLPGTSSLLQDRFVGIPPLDYLLRTLVLFFWEAVDGSNPKNSAAGIYFGSQLFPVILTLYLDNQRRGNGPSLLKPSLWFLAFSAAAIGFCGAPWAITYTMSSPLLSDSISLDALREVSMVASPPAASLLLPAALLGYALLLVFMGLHSPVTVSNNFQQWAIVAWNLFPLFITALVKAGELVLNTQCSAADRRSDSRNVHLGVVRWLGAGGVVVGFAMHVAVASVSISAALFPAIFAEGYAEAFHPLSLAVPPLSLTMARSVGDGIWGFMLWDQVAGFSLVMLVMLTQLRNVMKRRLGYFRWSSMVALSGLLSLLVGPGTAIMAVSWLRDELLYGTGVARRSHKD